MEDKKIYCKDCIHCFNEGSDGFWAKCGKTRYNETFTPIQAYEPREDITIEKAEYCHWVNTQNNCSMFEPIKPKVEDKDIRPWWKFW